MSSPSSSSSTASANASDDLLQRALGYVPLQGLSIAAMILFGLFFIILFYQAIRWRRHKYMFWLPFAALGEFIGYLFRYRVVDDPTTVNFVMFTLFLLVIPNVLALVNYSTVGRILRLVSAKPHEPTCWRIPIITDATGQFIPGRIAVFFVIGDVLSFAIQAASSGFLTSTDPSQISIGQKVILIGLALAVVFIGTFSFVTIYIYYSPRYSLRDHPQYMILQKIFFCLIMTISLLSIRVIYRLIEYSVGSTGYISTHEAFLYVFDTLMILTSLCLYALYPFGQLLTEVEDTPVLPLVFVSNMMVSHTEMDGPRGGHDGEQKNGTSAPIYPDTTTLKEVGETKSIHRHSNNNTYSAGKV